MCADPERNVFQLTASRRGWRENSSNQFPLLVISTHSLTKRLTRNRYRSRKPYAFQLTASRRGWLQPGRHPGRHVHISTHSLTKRLTGHFFTCTENHIFQLTASRRGWPRKGDITKYTTLFQLTASRRGWRGLPMTRWSLRHFNSQPHEEADATACWPKAYDGNFNSQPHEEADDLMISFQW